MEDYKGNSHKQRERGAEKEKLEKVISGSAKTKKKSEISKITDLFVPEDRENVKTFIISDIIVPSFKKVISDIVDMVLFGESRSKKSSNASRVSYRDYYDNKDRRNYSRSRSKTNYFSDDVIVNSRGDAENILDNMDDLIDKYGTASVGDLYDLAGLDTEYTDYKYGWTNVRNAEIVRVRGGSEYAIKMPRTMALD